MEQCPIIKKAYNDIKFEVSAMKQTAESLFANYTKARERFQIAHDYEIGLDVQHATIVKTMGKLIGTMDTHLKLHFGDVTPEAGSKTLSKVDEPTKAIEDEKKAIEDEAKSAPSLLEVNPESDGKGRIKKLQWTMESLHERLRSSHDIEKNETKKLLKMWEKKEYIWNERINKLGRRLRALQAVADEKRNLDNICSCKKRVEIPHFKSLDPMVIETPKFYAADMFAVQEAEDKDADDAAAKLEMATGGATGGASGKAKGPKAETRTHSGTVIGKKCGDKGACDATSFCDTEKNICKSKLNDGETCSDDRQCYHVCHENKCQAEKHSGDPCTVMKECNPTYLYCDVKTKTCDYRRHEKEMCTNNDMVMEGHYCRGGYVAAYKLEGQTCEADDTCEPTQSSDFALECINKVCRNKHASNAFIELPSIVDDSFVPEMCVDQATKYAYTAVSRVVRTNNRILQKLEDMEKNVADMINIGKLISADILPVVGIQTLKQVDEVFDETLMHKPMLASSEPQSWTVSNLDYFHDIKRYYKFKAVSGTSNVQVVFQKVDLECKYDYIQYFESTDCDDNKAKHGFFESDRKKVCNTADMRNPTYTQGPITLSGKCVYVRLYSNYMIDGNKYDLHTEAKDFKGLRATYKSI